MSILTPTIAVTIIWALFAALTTTISLRFYAIRIHNRRKEQHRSRYSDYSHPPQKQLITSKAVLTVIIITLHILTLLYCVAATLAIIWGYDLANKRRAIGIKYGWAESDLGNELVGGDEIGRLRRYLQRLGLAVELAYVVIVWILKGGLVTVGWQVGKGLGLWGSRSMAEAEMGNVNATDGNGTNTERERPMDAETKTRISMAKAALYLFGCGVIITFLGILIYEGIVIGMALSRNEMRDITSQGLRKEVLEAQNEVIVVAVGNLGTYLLSIILTVILLLISRSPHQPHPHPPQPPIFLYGGIFMLSLIILTTAASSARTVFILLKTTSTRPRIGDLIIGSILFGKATGSTYGEALGLNEKVFAVLEMVLGGTALCIPGMRVLFDSARRTRTQHSLRESVLLSKSDQSSPASAGDLTSRRTETRSEIAPVLPQQDGVLQHQRMSHNPDPYTAVAARIASFVQGPGGEGIDIHAITGRDRSRSTSRSGNREGSNSSGRNQGHVAPGAQLPHQGSSQQRQIEEPVQSAEEHQQRWNQQQGKQDRERAEGPKNEEGVVQRNRENDRREEGGYPRTTIQTPSRALVAPIPPLSISRQPQQHRGWSEKSLPPLPPSSERELVRDRELRGIGSAR